jgi:hypothetical protein
MNDKKKLPGRIRIIRDTYPQNPREEYDNLTVMVCNHRRYSLGDQKVSKEIRFGGFSGWDALKEALIEKYVPLAIEPIYMYDHSGITISTSPFSCPWDSGQIGFVLVPESQKGNYWNNDSKEPPTEADLKAWAERLIKAEVETYDQYLTGDVYGYVIDEAVEDPTRPGEQMIDCDEQPVFEEGDDSCWGFYGSDWKTNGMSNDIQNKVDAGYAIVEEN